MVSLPKVKPKKRNILDTVLLVASYKHFVLYVGIQYVGEKKVLIGITDLK